MKNRFHTADVQNPFEFTPTTSYHTAVLANLCAFADPSRAALNPTLHELGGKLLQLLAMRSGIELPELERVTFIQYWLYFDYRIIVNDSINFLLYVDEVDYYGMEQMTYRELLEKQYEAGEITDKSFPLRYNVKESLVQHNSNGYEIRDITYDEVLKLLLTAEQPLDEALPGSVEVKTYIEEILQIRSKYDAWAYQPRSEWDSDAWTGLLTALENRQSSTRSRFEVWYDRLNITAAKQPEDQSPLIVLELTQSEVTIRCSCDIYAFLPSAKARIAYRQQLYGAFTDACGKQGWTTVYPLLGFRMYRQEPEVGYIPIEAVLGSDTRSPNIERVRQHLRNLQQLIDFSYQSLKQSPLLSEGFLKQLADNR